MTRAHLEEDAGKSSHEGFGNLKSGIDYNRAGIALLEIVSERRCHQQMKLLLMLSVCTIWLPGLEYATVICKRVHFEMDANVSVKPKGAEALGTRCEIKNLNSFSFLKRPLITRRLGK